MLLKVFPWTETCSILANMENIKREINVFNLCHFLNYRFLQNGSVSVIYKHKGSMLKSPSAKSRYQAIARLCSILQANCVISGGIWGGGVKIRFFCFLFLKKYPTDALKTSFQLIGQQRSCRKVEVTEECPRMGHPVARTSQWCRDQGHTKDIKFWL